MFPFSCFFFALLDRTSFFKASLFLGERPIRGLLSAPCSFGNEAPRGGGNSEKCCFGIRFWALDFGFEALDFGFEVDLMIWKRSTQGGNSENCCFGTRFWALDFGFEINLITWKRSIQGGNSGNCCFGTRFWALDFGFEVDIIIWKHPGGQFGELLLRDPFLATRLRF